ncbi:hypothetical protein HEK131_30780 [Streptomyces seoulensis]|nr:hypothetical protein HEK131_30780 [Streptomyces seoulensis]
MVLRRSSARGSLGGPFPRRQLLPQPPPPQDDPHDELPQECPLPQEGPPWPCPPDDESELPPTTHQLDPPSDAAEPDDGEDADDPRDGFVSENRRRSRRSFWWSLTPTITVTATGTTTSTVTRKLSPLIPHPLRPPERPGTGPCGAVPGGCPLAERLKAELRKSRAWAGGPLTPAHALPHLRLARLFESRGRPDTLNGHPYAGARGVAAADASRPAS